MNQISGSMRMLAHGLLYVGKGNLAYIQEQTDQNQPDSWKGYNISNAAKIDNDPESLMRQWRHDDEEVAYPTFELIEKNYRKLKRKKPGFNNICQGADPDRYRRQGVCVGDRDSQFRAFKTAQDALDYEARIDRVLGALECAGSPIAAIAGACTGGGAGDRRCCDIRIGTETRASAFRSPARSATACRSPTSPASWR